MGSNTCLVYDYCTTTSFVIRTNTTDFYNLMKQIFVILALSLSSIAWADKVYTVETLPKLKVYNGDYVSDPDHLLKAETVQLLNRQLSMLEGITTDQIAIVVVGSIGKASPRKFAKGLYDRFRIGQKDKDNGLLILMVRQPLQLEFEMGFGMEGILADSLCKRIGEEYMLPQFKEKHYDQGLLDGLAVLIKVLNTPKNKNKEDSVLPIAQRKDSQTSGRIVAWILAVPYLLFISVFYFVKKSKGAFTEDYEKLSEAKKRNVSLTIPRWRWALLYFFVPLCFYTGMIYFYHGPYYISLLIGGAYGMILLVLLDKKKRCVEAYISSYKEGDYFDQYNQFNRYFDNWGVAAVFFPIPFLYTDARNNKKLSVIRRHARACGQCGTAMILLDEKKDDEYLQKNQILEESIKSIDYDVWFCPACQSHYALGYNSKFSKYKACSYCGTKASYLLSDVTKVAASYEHKGVGEKTYQCMYCKKVSIEEYTIAQWVRTSSSGKL
jgi:uncharacterized protein